MHCPRSPCGSGYSSLTRICQLSCLMAFPTLHKNIKQKRNEMVKTRVDLQLNNRLYVFQVLFQQLLNLLVHKTCLLFKYLHKADDVQQFSLIKKPPPLHYFLFTMINTFRIEFSTPAAAPQPIHTLIALGVPVTRITIQQIVLQKLLLLTSFSPALQPVFSFCPPPVKCRLYPLPSHCLNHTLIPKMV